MSEPEPETPPDPVDPRIAKAKALLASTVPFITADNWALMSEDGWRFEENHTSRNLKGFVEFFHDKFGEGNVSLGWMFPKHSEVPVEDKDGIITGLYIRDGKVQQTALHDMLDDDELVAGVLDQWSQEYKKKQKRR